MVSSRKGPIVSSPAKRQRRIIQDNDGDTEPRLVRNTADADFLDSLKSSQKRPSTP